MNKILIIFDVCALLALVFLIMYFSGVTSDVGSQKIYVEYFTGISFIGLLLMMPVLHGVVWYESRYDLIPLHKKWLNVGIACLLLLMLILSFYVSQRYKHKIISAGYKICTSERMTVGNYIVYGKGDASCGK